MEREIERSETTLHVPREDEGSPEDIRILQDADISWRPPTRGPGMRAPVIIYNEPKEPASPAGWWLAAECAMLAVYAIAATIWLLVSTAG